jgi:hypothetical protein
MTNDEAKGMAENFLLEKMPRSEKGDRFLIVDDGIIEEDDGWYFPYQTETFLRTRDLNSSVVGNAPIFVAKDGRIGFRMFGAPFRPAE